MPCSSTLHPLVNLYLYLFRPAFESLISCLPILQTKTFQATYRGLSSVPTSGCWKGHRHHIVAVGLFSPFLSLLGVKYLLTTINV
ncbi:hypothetical protein BJX63DRAFT_384248 [Aspergillus granulosus]|uniref:Uncharacterized protein n=1 Tax=Aspergillus granulosus TaxID=176169 RepID=A0ABR4HSN4_9EURO